MTELQVRRIPFDFEDVEFIWNPKKPGFSLLVNFTSFAAVGFERWLCKVFREVRPFITDPRLAEECDLFVKQEAMHAAVHLKHCRRMISLYPGLDGTLEMVTDYFGQLREKEPLEFNIAFAASLESSFTPSFQLLMRNRQALMGEGDARVASAILWHFAEEVEHRSTALDIYRHVYGNRLRCLQLLRRTTRYVEGLARMVVEDFARVAPEETRRGRMSDTWEDVPRRHRMQASVDLLASQMPWHDPTRASAPDWAEEWHAAYDAGVDMTRFIGISCVGPTEGGLR